MFDFRPTETPMGFPVITTFESCGGSYVVDIFGTMYRIMYYDPDPEYWVWTEVIQL